MKNNRSLERDLVTWWPVKRGPAKRWSAAVLTRIAATIAVAALLSACAGKSGGGGYDPGPPSRGGYFTQ